METAPFYISLLKQNLSKRCENNPRYSLRAFARTLDFEAGAISKIMAGKRVPSIKTAEKLVRALELSPQEENDFISSLAATHKRRGLERLSPFFKKYNPAKNPPKQLALETFRIIADWYHYAIMEMTNLEDFNSSPKWIAKQLDISELEAKLALERLQATKLLVEKNGKLVCSYGNRTTADKHVTNAALKRRQRQILEKGIQALENDPIEKRNHSAMTMAIDPEKIPEAKRRIEAFTHELMEFLESGSRKKVYELSIALFSLQKDS